MLVFECKARTYGIKLFFFILYLEFTFLIEFVLNFCASIIIFCTVANLFKRISKTPSFGFPVLIIIPDTKTSSLAIRPELFGEESSAINAITFLIFDPCWFFSHSKHDNWQDQFGRNFAINPYLMPEIGLLEKLVYPQTRNIAGPMLN
uniref:Uncharacterized protein n=1 Tax=OCS116 cluster bacterium TaxID=2030921 RepID=A0A2A4YZM4_9PROT